MGSITLEDLRKLDARDAAESYRSIPLFPDPHDEPPKLSDEYLSMCRKFDEARIICGYPVPTPAGSPAPPSFGPDWEQRAREHCRSIDILLAANAQRQKRIDALEARVAELEAVDRNVAGWPPNKGDILSSAMRGDRPLDPYGRPS